MKNIYTIILLALSSGLLFGQQCSLSGPILIGPSNINNGITEIQFNVSGLANDDLSSPLQGLCIVQLGLEHKNISTLEVEIISPAGQSVTMIGPGNVNPIGSTQFVDFNLRFAANSYPALPDPTFPEIFSSTNPWVAFTTYGGRYYPAQGQFEDLNMGSANGTWTIRFSEFTEFSNGKINYVEIQFCDETGKQCNPCYANAGAFSNVSQNTFCANDPILTNQNFFNVVNENSSFENTQVYNYVVVEAGNIVSLQEEFDLTGLAPGTYQLCGVISPDAFVDDLNGMNTYAEIVDFLSNELVCGDAMDVCLDLIIQDPGSPVVVQESFCSGDVLSLDGINFFETVDTLVYSYSAGGCEAATNYIISQNNVQAIISNNTGNTTIACNTPLIINGTSSIGNGLSYSWSTQSGSLGSTNGPIVQANAPGLYFLEVSDGVCTDVTSINVLPDPSFGNTILLTADSLGCTNTVAAISTIIEGDYDSFNWAGPGITDPSELEPSVSEPGIYTLTVNSANPGCPSVSASVVVAQSNSAAEPFFNNISVIGCNEVLTLAVVNNISVSEAMWTGPSGDTISLATTAPATLPGTYTFSYTDGFGCMFEKSLSIAGDYEELDVTYLIDSLGCSDFNAEIFTTVTGGIAESWSWRGPDTYNDNSPNPDMIQLPGLYIVTITDEIGCLTVDTVQVEYQEIAFNQMMNFPNITCDDREVAVRVLPGGPSFDYEWQRKGGTTILGTDSELLVTEGGTYYVTITRPSDGCSIRQFSFVNADTIPAKFEFDAGFIDCDSDSITIDSDANNFALTMFEWAGPDINDANRFEKFPLVGQTGEYTIVGFTSNGCSFMDTVQIQDDFEAFALSSNSQNFELNCSELDTSLIINGSRDATYSYLSPSGLTGENEGAKIGVPIAEIGTYQVVGIPSNGCSDTLEIAVTWGQSPPEVALDPPTVIDCNNTEVTLVAVTGGDTDGVSWSHDATATTEEVTINEPGTYIVTAINDAGCTAMDMVIIDDFSRDLDIEVVSDTLNCEITSAGIWVETTEGNLTYEWADASGPLMAGDTLQVTSEEVYYVTVTADDGCTTSDSLLIPSNVDTLALDVLAIAEINCIQDTVEANIDEDIVNVDSIRTIRWMLDGNIESEGLIGELTTGGTYTVELESENGCVSSQTVEVLESKIFPEITMQGDSITCLNPDGVVMAEVTGIDPSYSWSGPEFEEVGELELAITLPGFYSIEVTDSNGCVKVDSVEVKGDFTGPPTFANDLVISCNDPEIAIDLQMYDPDSVQAITIIDPDGDILNDPAALITKVGMHTVIALGQNGCETESTFEVDGDLEPPVASIEDQNIDCIMDAVELCVDNQGNIASFEWTRDAQDIGVSDSCFLTSEAGEYRIAIIGDNGCVDTLVSNVAIDTISPRVDIVQVGVLGCESTEASLVGEDTLSVDLRYDWTTNNGEIASVSTEKEISISSPGEYNLLVTNDTNGCISEQKIVVEDESSVFEAVEVSPMDPSCQGLANGAIAISDVVGGFAPLSYSIDGGESFSDVNFFEGVPAGNYDVVVRDSIGCEYTTMTELIDGRVVELNLGMDQELKLGETYTIMPVLTLDGEPISADNFTISWTATDEDFECIDCWEHTIGAMGTTIYTLTLVDEFGCTVEDRLIVRVDDTPPVFIPNIFQASGSDLDNKIVFNTGPAVEHVMKFLIMDRWGNQIFLSEDFSPSDAANAGNYWDGNYGGAAVQPGVFMYIAEILLINGDLRTIAGDITLIR